jgi:1,4-dihydroxy-2-naphthoyl-CoA hydrolase
MIWKQASNREILNEKSKNTLIEHLGIEILEIGDDFITANMPIDHRTRQPDGLLHGGASVALAETMGSFAGWLALNDPAKENVVGVEINASHLAPARDGKVIAKVTPVKIGKRVQVWNILISQQEKKICICRLSTMTVTSK